MSNEIIEKAKKIMKQPLCDHCLGRQFGQLLHGYTNKERGSMVRTAVAMSIDKADWQPDIEMSNFHGFKFHNLDTSSVERKKCEICGDLFRNLPKWIVKIKKRSEKYEFSSFLVGTKLSFDLVEKEEALWERIGIDHCEPLKAEVNREVGKLVEKELKVRFDPKRPQANIILNFDSGKVAIEINPLFIYGEYQKLKRGIPQTKWPSGKYKTSVEQIIAKPFMAATGGRSHKLHGMGREDIDARCLGWRPFVLEILEPRKRSIDVQKLAKKIAPAVRVRNVRFSDIEQVREIKELRTEKTYRALVVCEAAIRKADLRKLSQLKTISQKTPQRVLHRRADRYRKRSVKSIKARFITRRKFMLEIRGEAGLYIKELITGDSGRTEPNVSSLLGTPCTCKELDVLAIHH